ncbi:MAG: TatD family hydrolase [Clostridia bacterium]|nr:TatD family hydrolase [Clostridia bacterium]
MKLFDTHAHLLDEAFDLDREAVIASLPEKGITKVMEACCDEAGIDRVAALVERVPFFYGSAGVHPHSADEWTNETGDHIRRALRRERMLAVGEIGLDYHYDFSPRDVQKRVLDEQLSLAKELRLPVILHDREAHGDMIDLLRAHKDGLQGVMHCFSGSYELAKECLDLGLYVAFGGALTFQNAVRPIDVVKRLPLDRLLIETDCPYMTPVPYRGQRNDPSFVRITLDRMAEVRGEDVGLLADALYRNALRVYNIAEEADA